MWLDTINGLRVESLASSSFRFQKVDYLWDYYGKEIVYKTFTGFKCDITRSDFTFDLDKNDQSIKKQMFDYYYILKIRLLTVEMNWFRKLKKSLLTKQFNIFAFLDYFTDFYYYIWFKFVYSHGFELSLLDQTLDSWMLTLSNNSVKSIYLINSDLRYLINEKLVKKCDDISSANLYRTNILSLFQIPMVQLNAIYLFGCRFLQILCPLVFAFGI